MYKFDLTEFDIEAIKPDYMKYFGHSGIQYDINVHTL